MIVVEHSTDSRIPVHSQMISINDHLIGDFLEFDYYNDITRTRTIQIRLDNRTTRITFKPEEKIPVSFKAPVYRTCNNDCEFCFIRGLPSGLRTQLYMRDDDYRLSFLFGNFLSLTNISDMDIERIGRLRLSPLYVSVHTTDPDLRVRMFKNKRAGAIIDQLKSLIKNRIHIHCQIVVIPGINDHDVLEKTISDLGTLFPGVASIGVIPVGRTRYAPEIPLITPAHADTLIDLINSMHARFRDQYGIGLVYAADELYMLTRRTIPPAQYYDDVPQIENGIGMVRSFLDEIKHLKGKKKIKGRVLFITSQDGALCITTLQQRLITQGMIQKHAIRTIVVNNDFFGPTVTVSGLLSAQDIHKAIVNFAGNFDRIILPPNCTNDEHEFIDSNCITVDTLVAPESIKELVQWLQS